MSVPEPTAFAADFCFRTKGTSGIPNVTKWQKFIKETTKVMANASNKLAPSSNAVVATLFKPTVGCFDMVANMTLLSVGAAFGKLLARANDCFSEANDADAILALVADIQNLIDQLPTVESLALGSLSIVGVTAAVSPR